MSVSIQTADFDLSDHFDHPTLMRAIGLKPDHALLSQHEDGDRLHTRLPNCHGICTKLRR
mgnify:CR=1 FL=1